MNYEVTNGSSPLLLTPGTVAAAPPANALTLVAPSAGLNDIRRAVLAHIAGGEAKRYNEFYGGGSFDSYADHPRQRFEAPNGTHTSAAGLYQFQAGTWDDEKQRLKLPDFSPASQDLAAWDLAQRTYHQQTGRSLEGDASAGKVNWGALKGQWTSLSDGVGPVKALSAGSPPATPMSPLGPTDRWTPSPGSPSPPLSADGMNPAHLLLAAAMPHVKITPIDYDPFKVMPKDPTS